MGKFHVINRPNSSTYRGSSHRGSVHTSGVPRGYHSTTNGRVGSSRQEPKAPYKKLDTSRIDARDYITQKARRDQDRSTIHDARDVLRQTNRGRGTDHVESNDSRGATRDYRREQAEDRLRHPRRTTRGSSRGSYQSDRKNSFDRDRKDRVSSSRPRSRSRDNSRRNEPLVIVSGLGNRRSFRSEQSAETHRQRDHYVTNSGKNTLVTLNNDKYNSRPSQRDRSRRSRSRSRSNEKSPEDTNQQKRDYEPIKIKITNSNYVPPKSSDEECKESRNQKHDTRIENNNTYKNNQGDSNYKSDDSMEYESSNSDYDQKYNSNQIQNQAPPQNSMRVNVPLINQFPALLPNPPAVPNTLNSMSGFNTSYKPPGIVVNNFPTGGMYSTGFDRIWNPNTTNFFNHNSKPNITAPPPVMPVKSIQTPVFKEGYKLLVSNLHPKVSEDDVLELFSDIGPIKRARFVDKGLAEVVYVRIDHAKEAIQKYDLKELDGRQMVIGFADKSLLSSSEAINSSVNNYTAEVIQKVDVTKRPPPILNHVTSGQIFQHNNSHLSQTRTINQNINLAQQHQHQQPGPNNFSSSASSSFYEAANTLSQTPAKSSLSNRFKSNDQSQMQIPESKHLDKTQSINYVDNSIIHQVLFNKKAAPNGSPVTFTVKL